MERAIRYMVYYGNNTYQLCLSEGESQSVTDRVTRDSEKNKEHFITMHETQAMILDLYIHVTALSFTWAYVFKIVATIVKNAARCVTETV